MPFSGSSFSGDSFAGEGAPADAQPSSNVNLRFQWRESSKSTWFDGEEVVSQTSSHELDSLKEGEEYEVRVRTETSHSTGSWSPTATQTTRLPVPTRLILDAVGDTQVDLTWTLNSTDEDGVRIFRANYFVPGFGEFEEVADLAAGTESYSDTTVEAASAYRYYVQAYTEHVTGDTNPVDVATGGRLYWAHVGENSIDVNHLSSFTFDREHSALSTWSATTVYDETLEDFKFEPIRLYYGEKFLYRGIVQKIGSDTSQNTTTLSGVGVGDILRRGEATVQFENELAWRALRTYLEEYSPIPKGVVTEPDPLDSVSNQTLLSGASTADWKDNLMVSDGEGGYVHVYDDDGNKTADGEIQPIAAQNGNVELLDTCFFIEGEDHASSTGRGTTSGEADGHSGADGVIVENTAEFNTDGSVKSGDVITWEFTNEYTIPADHLRFQARDGGDSDSTDDACDFTWQVRPEGGSWRTIETTDNYVDITGLTLTFGWSELGFTYEGSGWDGAGGGDLPPGTHEIRVVCDDGGGSAEHYTIDCLAVYDDRYSYTFDESVDGNDALSGPERAPESIEFWLESAKSAYRITNVDITATFNDVSGGQQMDYSVTDGDTFEGPFSNTSTINDQPASIGQSVFPAITLGRYTSGTPTTTPTTGNALQQLEDITASIDGELNAVISDLTVDATHFDNIAKLANRAGMRWVIDFDEDNAWIDAFRRGDRVGTADWTVLDHSRTYDGEGYANHVTVKGARQEDGSRLKAVASEPSEFGVGVRRYTDVKPAIDNREDLESIAETILQERLGEDRITGTLDIAPEPITPGYSYPVGEWDDDVAQGGYALDFDGDDDYVKAPGPDPLQFDPTTDDITFACRFKADELTDGQRLMAKESHEADVRLRIGPNDNLIWTVAPDTGSPSFFDLLSNKTLETGVWYTVVGVFDADIGATLYINGTEDNSNTTTFSSASADSAVPDLFIGASRPDFLNFNGIIDDVVVDMSAWSAAKVDRYVAGIVPSDVLMHFPFNEGSGDTVSGFVEAPDSFDYTFDFTFHTPTPIGTINGADWVGTEVALEKVGYSVDGTRLDGSLHFEDESGLGRDVVGVGNSAKDSRDAL